MNSLTRIASFSIRALVLSGASFLLAGSLMAQSSPAPAAGKLSASALQVERMDPPDNLVVPEDFRIATYENVIRAVRGTKKFPTVYRSGDTRAASESNLVVMHLIPVAFKEGSQKQREVTTVSGATSIKVKVQFTGKDGKVLMEKELEGRVRFYGENLNATHDLAKKVAATVNESF